MRPKILLALICLAPAFISSQPARAQFQAPTKEELQMTEDPKVPGAVAVYLNFEEITDDPLHYQSVYARIKVLEEKGKELATVGIPYPHRKLKITNIKGRTIHSDGTIIPLTVKPEDLLMSETGEITVNRRVFTLPSVEVGSIIEYRYDLRYDDDVFSSPNWELQRQFFVHKAHYGFTPFKAFQRGSQSETGDYLTDSHGKKINPLLWWSVLPPGAEVKTDASGRFSLNVTDIPPTPNEEWMPPIQSVLFKVRFYYTSAFGGSDYWVSEARRWSSEVDHFAEPSKAIHDAVSGLILPSDSDLDKAKKLYRAVQALDNTDFSRKRDLAELKVLGLHVAKRAEDTWSQKSGSSEDIALLYLAMARAAGLTAYAMRVVNRDEGAFATGYFNFNQLNDDIILLTLNGKELALDPGEKMCPFLTVHWKHTGAGGIRQSADGRAAAISPLQPPAANTIDRIGDINVDDHGAITAYLRISMTGQQALHWRQQAVQNDLGEVKARFDEWLKSNVPKGIDAHVDHFLALDDPDVALIAVIKAKGTLGTATTRRIVLPGFFFSINSQHPFVDRAQRLQPVDMHYAEQISDDVTYHLLPGMTVEGSPQDTKIPWEGHALLVTKAETDTGEITLTRRFVRAFTFAKPEEFHDLQDFYQKVATADQQQLVLSRALAAKGN